MRKAQDRNTFPRLLELMKQSEEIEIIRGRLQKKAIELGLEKADFGKISSTKIERKGSVDYSKIPELKSIDLEQYRKKSSTSWRMDVK